MANYLYLEMEYNRVWCPLGVKTHMHLCNCISAVKMPTIKALTGVQYMPPTPKPEFNFMYEFI